MQNLESPAGPQGASFTTLQSGGGSEGITSPTSFVFLQDPGGNYGNVYTIESLSSNQGIFLQFNVSALSSGEAIQLGLYDNAPAVDQLTYYF